VSCYHNGRPYTSQKVVEYHLYPLLDALKIKRAGFHAFRHAHTTLHSMVALRQKWRNASYVIRTRELL